MRVKLYWNLHKDCFSVMDAKTGRVAFHADTVALRDVKTNVQAGGRARAVREGKRNVHAFLVGELVEAVAREGGRVVRYNPFRASFFHDETGETVDAASYIYGETVNGRPHVRAW
jgi:hypothetical protein